MYRNAHVLGDSLLDSLHGFWKLFGGIWVRTVVSLVEMIWM